MNKTLEMAANLRAQQWPTASASASDAKGSGPTVKRKDGKMRGDRLDYAAEQIWATPTSHERTFTPRKVDHGAQLANQADQWSTPSVADVEGGRKARSGNRSTELLNNSLAPYVMENSWPTPTALSRPRNPETLEKCADYRKAKAGQNTAPLYLEEVAQHSSLPAPETSTGGEPSSPNAPSSLRLSPLFVEWLMGWPPGWTDFACSATELSAWKARMRSALSQLVSPAAPPAQLSLFA